MGWPNKMRKWFKRAEIMLGLPVESDNPLIPSQKEYAARFDKKQLARGVAAALRIRRIRDNAKTDLRKV